MWNAPADAQWRRAVLADDADWDDIDSMLLAAVVDELRIANWMKTEDGQKGRNRPKPIPRPGIPDNTKRHGSRVMDLEATKKWLRQWAPPKEEPEVSGDG